MECIERYPVRAAAHYLRAVYDKAELPRVTALGVASLKHHITYTEADAFQMNELSAPIYSRLSVIYTRLTVSVGIL